MNLFSMRKTDREGLLKMIAGRRVERGIKWLDEHAPQGWWLRLFSIRSTGKWHFLAQNCLSNGCVLARAFQTRAELANEEGYVTYATVMRNFPDLRVKGCDRRLGFESEKRISMHVLDTAWERIRPRVVSQRGFGPLQHPPKPMSEESMRALDFSLNYMRTHGIPLYG